MAADSHLGLARQQDTLSNEDLEKVVKLIQHRPLQFCLFLRALIGLGGMGRLMVEAIKAARDLGDL